MVWGGRVTGERERERERERDRQSERERVKEREGKERAVVVEGGGDDLQKSGGKQGTASFI